VSASINADIAAMWSVLIALGLTIPEMIMAQKV